MQTRPRRRLGAAALAVIAVSATIAACDGSTAGGPTAAAGGSNRAPSDPAPGLTAAAAELTPGVTRAAALAVCGHATACRQSVVEVWRAAGGRAERLALDSRACGHHRPSVYFDAAGTELFVAAEFPWSPSAPPADPTRQRAEAQLARIAELTRGLTVAQRLGCAQLPTTQGSDAPPGGSATPAPVPAPRRPTQDPAPVADGASLTCELKSFADRLELTYRVREKDGREAWVLDALPEDQKPAARREDPIYLAWSERAAALRAVQGIAPLPPDRLVEVRVIPFATRLAPRATLERVVRIPLPVRETGPYDPPDPSTKTRAASVEKLVLDVHLLRSDLAGFESKPWPHLPGTHFVRSANVVGDARRVTCELAIPPTHVFFAPRGFTRVE